MKKKLLQRFINKYPDHFLSSDFRNMINEEIIEFNILRNKILAAIKQQLLSPLEINQTDMLLSSMSLARD